MNLRILKTIAIVLGGIIVALLVLLIILMLRARRADPETPAPTAVPVTASPAPAASPSASPDPSPAATDAARRAFRADDLIGTWREIGDPDCKLTFTEDKLRWTGVFGDSGKSAYTVEKEYAGLAEGAMRIECPDYGGPFEYIIWHMEEIDGRFVGVLSGVIMEYDGRGPVTFDEFLRDADGVSVPEDWRSSVSHTLNDRDPAPTVILPDDGEAAE